MIELTPSSIIVKPEPEELPLLKRLTHYVRHRFMDVRRLTDEEIDLYITIIAHPQCLPTREELACLNRFSDEQLDAAITSLLDTPLVCSVVATPEETGAECPIDGPVSMYGLTEVGATLAESAFPTTGLRRDYAELETPEEIRPFEDIPRPPTREVHTLPVAVAVSSTTSLTPSDDDRGVYE